MLQAMETEGYAQFFTHRLGVTVTMLNENAQTSDTGHVFGFT